MYPGDEESSWKRETFTDHRVQQRWDEPKVAGAWFLAHLGDLTPAHAVAGKFPQRVDAMWDTWMLFGRNAVDGSPGRASQLGYRSRHAASCRTIRMVAAAANRRWTAWAQVSRVRHLPSADGRPRPFPTGLHAVVGFLKLSSI